MSEYIFCRNKAVTTEEEYWQIIAGRMFMEQD
jgi:hypothetical protein